VGSACRLYDITTETGDFIANGVVSHNCYARPSHAYLGLSPGLDFETRLFAKEGAADLLRAEFDKPGYECEPINIGSNTDGYQPLERERRITRSLIELFHETSHPVGIVTKNALVERDLDLLAPMAANGLVAVSISVTTLDNGLAHRMEPRASAPRRRLEAVRRLADAGVPVGVNVAPVIPFLTDHEVESLVEAAAQAGAKWVSWTLLRLPWEVKDLFRGWLETHVPLKAAHVMSRVHEMRGGKDNDPRFGTRMTGEGLFADLLRRRVGNARRAHGLGKGPPSLETMHFVAPSKAGQGRLF
jgi:DNA repair photolyase